MFPLLLVACHIAALYGCFMCCVISFVNTKGGVGKSFLSTSLAVWLNDRGNRVTLVDSDDQKTSSRWLGGVKHHNIEIRTLNESSEEERAEELRVTINRLRNEVDFVVIDTKGAAGLTTASAVLKSDIACVPLQASAADLWPIENALSTIRLSQETRSGLPRAFLILNQTEDSDVGASQVRKLAEKFKVPMASTNIKRLRAYRNAPGMRISPTRLRDRRGGKAAERLEILFRELLNDFNCQQEVSNG